MSAKFEVAHIHEQGQDIIIVVVGNSFGNKSVGEQNEIRESLQLCASSAGLKGTVVLVWDASGGRMGFIAPNQWHSYFSGMSLANVAVNINRSLTCG